MKLLIILSIGSVIQRRRYIVTSSLTGCARIKDMGTGSAIERWRYIVTPPLICCAHTQNDTWYSSRLSCKVFRLLASSIRRWYIYFLSLILGLKTLSNQSHGRILRSLPFTMYCIALFCTVLHFWILSCSKYISYNIEFLLTFAPKIQCMNIIKWFSEYSDNAYMKLVILHSTTEAFPFILRIHC